MRRPSATIGIFLLLLCASVLALAESPEPHFASPRTNSVVRQSTFLHGYLHGYEEGYSTADVDLQMAREPRDPAKIKEARSSTGYRSAFGPRRVFDAGYVEGFRVGYADSLASRTFRAVDVIRQVMDLPVNPVAMTDSPQSVRPPEPRVPHASALFDLVAPLPETDAPPPNKREEKREQKVAGPAANAFDAGFVGGYSTGRRRGLADARSALPFAAATSTCPAALSGGQSGPESCAAYVRGFAMGYSDGYVNVAHPTAASASAAQSK